MAQLLFTRPLHLPRKLCTQDPKGPQADDLPGYTSNHDVDPHLNCVVFFGGGGDPSAGGLEEQRDNVASDEEDGIGAGLEAGERGGVDGDDSRKGEVDGGSQEGRAEG